VLFTIEMPIISTCVRGDYEGLLCINGKYKLLSSRTIYNLKTATGVINIDIIICDLYNNNKSAPIRMHFLLNV
jgi:hypothetical protein